MESAFRNIYSRAKKRLGGKNKWGWDEKKSQLFTYIDYKYQQLAALTHSHDL
jgi:hypothetical protein